MATLLKLDESKIPDLEKQIDSQVIPTGYQRSVDPNYPVFKVGDNVGTRKLFYIPVIKSPGGTVREGVEELNVESANVHQVMNSNGFTSGYRCVSGIDSIDGYDGTCPFDDVVQEVSGQVTDMMETFDTSAPTGPGYDGRRKEYISSLYRKFGTVSRPLKMLAIPVAVFDLVGDEGVDFAPNPEKKGAAKPPVMYWWILSAKKYEETIAKPLKNYSIKNAAGHLFIVEYPANPAVKNDARYAGGNMIVTLWNAAPEAVLKTMKRIDEMAQSWTREKARETLTEFGFMPFEEIQSIAKGAHTRLMNLKRLEAQPSIDHALNEGLSQSQLPPGMTDAMPDSFGGAPQPAQATPQAAPQTAQASPQAAPAVTPNAQPTVTPVSIPQTGGSPAQAADSVVSTNTGLPSNLAGFDF